MIELNKKTQQDFLNREWVQKLLDAGVDMSDAKYCIFKNTLTNIDYIQTSELLDWREDWKAKISDRIPTYTASELLYKLNEYIYPIINGKEYFGSLKFCKDAPFYIWYYALESEDYIPDVSGDYKEDYIHAGYEYPIESLASILIQCHQKGIGDVGNISDK